MSKHEDTRMFVTVTHGIGSKEFFHVIARPVYMAATDHGPDMRFFSDYSDEQHFSDLQIRCQGETHSDSDPYGTEVVYRDVLSINMMRAQSMARQLKSIDTKLERLKQQFGYANTYAEYLARVMVALKIECFGFPSTLRHREVTGMEFDWHRDASVLSWQINDRIKNLREAAGYVAS